MKEENILEIDNLSINYGNIVALESINLEIKNGECVAIVGPNGGGKSTLVKSIVGLIPVDKDMINLKQNANFGYVPQRSHFDITFPITVKEVVMTGRLGGKIKLFHKYSQDDKDQLIDVVKKLNLDELVDRRINELSGGQLQRTLIARALMTRPNILILDEPNAGLDVESKKNMNVILEELNKDMTIIIVTHDVGEILDFADTIVHINKKSTYHTNIMKKERC